MVKNLLLFCLIFLVFGGCSKLDSKIDAPAYLEIDDYRTITDSITQGTNNQTFTDVLITSSTQSYGYYPIPGKIPIPLKGSTYVSIRPVIKVNGVSYLRVDYPMMRGCDTSLNLTSGQILKFTPVFKYFTSVKFRYKEDFEGGAFNTIVNANAADTFCIKTDNTQNFYGGHFCLLMQLNASHTSCQANTYQAIPLPTNGTGVYLEINYKCNTAFETGVIGTSSPNGTYSASDIRPVGGANASSTWKKMYFNLTDVVRTAPVYSYYYLYFRTTYDVSSTTNLIYIDNIKIVTQI